MTRRLILMRHAKSSWADENMSDHERPLNKRGRRAAVEIAGELSDRNWLPDLVVSSTARRTQETWERMRPILGDAIPLRSSADLYLAALGDLQGDSTAWPNDVQTILCLGHNPGWERAVGLLSGRPHHMTTANAALLLGEGSAWSEALARPWELVDFLRPTRD